MAFPFIKDADADICSIKQQTHNQQKKIVITYKKTWAAVFMIIILLFVFAFLAANSEYTLLIFPVAFSATLIAIQYSKKISIIKDISDGSIIVIRQTDFRKEVNYYKQEDKPQLKPLKLFDVKERFTDKDHFALAVTSDNTTTLLRFLDMQLIEGRVSYFTKYRNLPLLRNKEVQGISIFLDLPLSDRPGDLMTILKEKAFY